MSDYFLIQFILGPAKQVLHVGWQGVYSLQANKVVVL